MHFTESGFLTDELARSFRRIRRLERKHAVLQDLSLQYRMLAFQPTYSAERARELIGQETGFGEVHLLTGQRASLNGNLAGAFRDLTRARQLLPDSVSIAFALANVTFSYARYADALALFDRILESPSA